MKKLLLTAILATVSFSATAKSDIKCTRYPANEQMNPITIQKKLTDDGYLIREFKVDNNCYKVKTVDAKGNRVKMYMDMKTGTVLNNEKHAKKDRKERRNQANADRKQQTNESNQDNRRERYEPRNKK